MGCVISVVPIRHLSRGRLPGNTDRACEWSLDPAAARQILFLVALTSQSGPSQKYGGLNMIHLLTQFYLYILQIQQVSSRPSSNIRNYLS